MVVLLLISIFLCMSLAAAYENLYAVVVYPHQQLCMREFLTYEPFSGKLFQIDPSVGLSYVSYHISSPTCTTHVEEIEIADPATIAQLIDLLNDFRYNYWSYQDRRHHIGKGGRVYLTLQSAKRVQPYEVIVIENNRLTFGDTWYYGDSAYFEKLRSLLTE